MMTLPDNSSIRWTSIRPAYRLSGRVNLESKFVKFGEALLLTAIEPQKISTCGQMGTTINAFRFPQPPATWPVLSMSQRSIADKPHVLLSTFRAELNDCESLGCAARALFMRHRDKTVGDKRW